MDLCTTPMRYCLSILLQSQLGIHGEYPEVIKAFEEFPLMQTETSDMAMETLE